MEYSEKIDYSEDIIDQNYNKYIGWQEDDNSVIAEYYSAATVKKISEDISNLLKGVVSKRKIVVPDSTIIDVMNDVQSSYRPANMHISGQYNTTQPQNALKTMIDQTIEIITNDVRNSFENSNHPQEHHEQSYPPQ